MKNLWKSTAWLLLVFASLFMSCSEDDNLPKQKENPETEANTNANPTQQDCNYARLEFPHIKADGNNLVIVHSTKGEGINYSVEWDCDKKAQRWSCYEMDAANSVRKWNRNDWKNPEYGGKDPFQEDLSIPKEYRTTLADYQYTGYDRGHICPSADRLNSKDANEQTFYLSNMQPQVNGFNTGVWATMESQLRTVWNTSKYRDMLYVCKGGTIDKSSQIAGYAKNKLIVPKYFFAAILAVKDGQYKAIGLWFEHKKNNDKHLSNYVVSIDELEKLTGIDFFCNLPDKTEKKVESATKAEMLIDWGL